LLVGIKGNIDKYLNVGTPNPFHFLEPQPMEYFERTETLNPKPISIPRTPAHEYF
jgi:hypothetical protein